MRRYGQINVDIWNDDDYRALGVDAQWTYEMLFSQSDINYCGVIPLRPKRWSAYAADITSRRIKAAVAKLAAAGFLVVDDTTEEAFVRTFIKHNKVMEQEQLRKSMVASYQHIVSKTIKRAVWHAAEQIRPGALPNPDPGPQGGGQAADQGAHQSNGKPGGQHRGIGVTDSVSDFVPVPKPEPSSSNPDPFSLASPSSSTTEYRAANDDDDEAIAVIVEWKRQASNVRNYTSWYPTVLQDTRTNYHTQISAIRQQHPDLPAHEIAALAAPELEPTSDKISRIARRRAS